MAYIKKIYDDKLSPNNPVEIYPITSSQAVYNTENVTIDAMIIEGYRFGGLVEPEDSPALSDTNQRAFYITGSAGTYTAFGELIVEDDEIALLIYDGSTWTKGILIKAINTDKIADSAITTPKIAEQAVTTDKIKDANVIWSKLDENVQNLIATGGGQHGTPFATEFGDSDLIGITQRVLTESRDDLQAQIDAIVMGQAEVNLSVSPAVIYVGVATDIQLIATTNTSATSIKIKLGDTELATGSGSSLSTIDEDLERGGSTTVTYTAEFVISGLNKSTTKNVSVVYPIYFGAGDDYTDIDDTTHRASARTSYAGTYNITNSTNGKYIMFCIPVSISTTKPNASMNGFDFPLADAEDVTINSVAYKLYKSAETQDAGSYSIVLS